jgi:hypothetical protein
MADFIERLCENNDKPELQCNGKCHLKKVVENNHPNEKAPFKELNVKEVTLYVLGQLNYDFVLMPKQDERLMDYNNLYAYTFVYSTDHPPQL